MTPWLADPDVTLYHGDALETVRAMPDESVDCVVTSPPYWGLRDYGTGEWDGGDPDCDHTPHVDYGKKNDTNTGAIRGGPYKDVCGKCGARRVDRQMGLEPTPDLFVAGMVELFREIRRVLADHGTCWVNLGDSYAHNNTTRRTPDEQERELERDAEKGYTQAWQTGTRAGWRDRAATGVPAGLKEKDLVGIPWRVAFALQADGWWLRSDIVWAKPNPMPESVTDRPTKSHEYVFLLTKAPRYWFDQEAVREPAEWARWGDQTVKKPQPGTASWIQPKTKNELTGDRRKEGFNARWDESEANGTAPTGRNVRSVWTIATQPYPEAHFACVDDQTEALTPWGWQRHDALTDGTPIAMYDPATDTCRFSPATFHRYPYDGEMVAIEKRDSSQRLTPNHRCYVRRRSGETAVVRADELKPGMDVLTCAPLDVQEIEGVGKRHAALLGWYTAEGSDHHDGYVYIYQSESANPQHVETIRELLSGVGASVKERTRYRTFLGRGGLNVESAEVAFAINGETARWLQACGKQLDPATMRLPVGEAEALLDALIAGDGHRRADGRACIVQKDKVSIDRMQMLALRLGYRAVVSQRKDGQYVLYLTRGRWLTLRGTNGSHAPIGREHYRGIVWCPNVETGFWLARRNGRPFITGNTFPEEFARRCIVAGCPTRVCRVCGKPSERIVESRPDERTPYITVGTGPKADEVRGDGSNRPQKVLREDGRGGDLATRRVETVGWSDCGHNNWRPGLVLDPFIGSGTTAKVARDHQRHAIGIDLNEQYLELAARRLQQLSLLTGDAA